MYKKNQFYCLPPQWLEDAARSLEGNVINDNIINLPETLGKGHAFFTLVVPGISVLLIDCNLNAPLKINRIKEETERYILHFDVSEHINIINIHNKKHKVGVSINLGLAVIGNQDNSSFEPVPKGRTFTVRIFIDKKLMDELINDDPGHEFIKQKINFSQKSFFLSDNIDSNSLLFLLDLKENSMFEAPFTSNIKGIALKLLSNTINRYAEPVIKGITKVEEEGIIKTKDYLLENLYNPFPSIKFLSEMAGMSGTKFKILFKKRFRATTKKVFTQEKMLLANQLLKSGQYNNLTEIIHELNYTKLDHFSARYFKFFKRKPTEDFVKKDDNKND